MGLEATSWDWLRNGLKKALPGFTLLERVENGVGVGMADVNYVIRGVEGWIELKAVTLPAREGTPVLGDEGLRDPDQINWHLARAGVCGRTWVFISAAPYRWLVAGVYAKQINGWTRDELCTHAHVWYDENWTEALWKRMINALSSDTYVRRRPV